MRSYKNYFLYVGIFLGVFCLSFAALYIVGAVPAEFQVVSQPPPPEAVLFSTATSSSSSSGSPSTKNPSKTSTSGGEASGGTIANPSANASTFFSGPNLPERIIIPAISVNAPILNPETTDVVALNTDLLKGAVRWPNSAAPGQGTVFIFGHNTGLPAINQAYKTFNGLRTVKAGEQIELDTATTAYFYTITSLDLVNSDSAYVTLSASDNELVVATCNVFGAKEQRYVVHAAFASSKALTSL
jgi:LPXTG-site transpeptidase (sortase) family protein